LTNAATAPAKAGATARARATLARRRIAQENCNRIAAEKACAMDGGEFANYLLAGALAALNLDELRCALMRLTVDGKKRLPAGLLEFVEGFARLISDWRIPRLRKDGSPHPHAGERYSGILTSVRQIARGCGIDPSQWTRAVRPEAERLQLIVCVPTWEAKRAGFRSREGAALPNGEGRTLILPGTALLELLGIRNKRVVKRARRLATALLRARARGRSGCETFTTKRSVSSSFRRTTRTNERARGALPLVLQLRRSGSPKSVPRATRSATTRKSVGAPSAHPPEKAATTGGAALESPTGAEPAAVALGNAQGPPEPAAPSPMTLPPVEPPSETEDEAQLRRLRAELYAKLGAKDRPPPIGESASRPAPTTAFGVSLGAMLERYERGELPSDGERRQREAARKQELAQKRREHKVARDVRRAAAADYDDEGDEP
jgi:hypothetical protein